MVIVVDSFRFKSIWVLTKDSEFLGGTTESWNLNTTQGNLGEGRDVWNDISSFFYGINQLGSKILGGGCW